MRFMYPRRRADLKRHLHKQQGGLCCYCGRLTDLHPEHWPLGSSPPANFATIEHLRRVADGGTNDPDNLKIACIECNNERDGLGMSWVEYKTIKQDGLPLSG